MAAGRGFIPQLKWVFSYAKKAISKFVDCTLNILVFALVIVLTVCDLPTSLPGSLMGSAKTQTADEIVKSVLCFRAAHERTLQGECQTAGGGDIKGADYNRLFEMKVPEITCVLTAFGLDVPGGLVLSHDLANPGHDDPFFACRESAGVDRGAECFQCVLHL